METFMTLSSLHGFLFSVLFFLTIEKGSACRPPSSPLCFRRNSEETVYICEWSMDGNESNVAFDLLFDSRTQPIENIRTTRYRVTEERLITGRAVKMWVNAHVGNSTCTSPTSSAVLGQTVKFDSPRNVSGWWNRKNLTVRWMAAEPFPALAEIWFRRDKDPTDSWEKTTTNTTTVASMYRAVVGTLQKNLSYQVQIRHQSTQVRNPLWSNWSPVESIPAELEREPEITWKTQELNGMRKVVLNWKSMPPAASVKGVTFFLKNTQSSQGCPCEQKISRTNSTKFTVYVSLSAVNISVFARNEVGTSPPATIHIPAKNVTDVKICNKTLLDEKLDKRTCLEWYEEEDSQPTTVTILLGRKKKKEKAQIKSTIQDYIRYRYLEHRCHGGKPQTTKVCLFYHKEGAPNEAPQELTAVNETYDSVNLRWTAIPLKNRRGFLTHYNLCSVKSSLQNETKECFKLSPTTVEHCLENLLSGTKYNISLSGVTVAGTGPEATLVVNTKPKKSVNVWLSFGLLFLFFLFSVTCTIVFKSQANSTPTVPERKIRQKILPPVPIPVIQDFPSHQPETQVIMMTLLQVPPEGKAVCEEAEEVTVLRGESVDGMNEVTELEGDDSGGSEDERSNSDMDETLRATREGETMDPDQGERELAMLIYRNGLVLDARTDSS